MKLRHLYSEAISALPETIREAVFYEAPHTRIVGVIPSELKFLDGALIDLGFENLGLPPSDYNDLLRAFISDGVRIPDTPWKLRYTKTATTVVEKSSGTEFLLPPDWKEAVLVFGGANDSSEYSWIGSKVRPDQIGVFD